MGCQRLQVSETVLPCDCWNRVFSPTDFPLCRGENRFEHRLVSPQDEQSRRLWITQCFSSIFLSGLSFFFLFLFAVQSAFSTVLSFLVFVSRASLLLFCHLFNIECSSRWAKWRAAMVTIRCHTLSSITTRTEGVGRSFVSLGRDGMFHWISSPRRESSSAEGGAASCCTWPKRVISG